MDIWNLLTNMTPSSKLLGISCKIFRFHKSTLALACREPPKGFQILFFKKLAKAWLLCVIPANFRHGLRVAVADLLVLSSHASSVVSQQLGSCGFGMSSPSRTRQETHNVLCWNRLPAPLRPQSFLLCRRDDLSWSEAVARSMKSYFYLETATFSYWPPLPRVFVTRLATSDHSCVSCSIHNC